MAKAEEILEGDRLLRGHDVMLPKYVISSGRGLNQSEAHLSMARLYFRNMDEVMASIQGKDDSFSSIGTNPATYIGFILQSVSESRTEKVQTLPLAGDSFHSTFFGEMPRQYVFSGMLFNSKNARWREAFDRLYDNYLRGYKSAGAGRPVQIIYDNKIVSGWITNVSQRVDSTNEMLAPFNMTLQVIRDTPLTPVDDVIDTVESYSHEHAGPLLGVTDTSVNLGPDDYIRKASISLPMRASSSSSVAGRCRVKNPTTTRQGNEKATSAPQGAVKSKSPIRDTCDMAEAVVYHLRRIETAEAKLATLTPGKDAAKIKAQNRIVNRAETHLRRLQGWAKDPNTKGYNRLQSLGADLGASGLITNARQKGAARTVTSTALKAALAKIKRE